MDHTQALPIGTMVLNEYRIEEVLGAGGFGITYRATDLQLENDVAIKEYFPSSMAVREATTEVHTKSSEHSKDYDWALKKFIKEAQTIARFRHDNIVRVYRTFQANNTAYIVLEYVRGEDLDRRLKSASHPPTQDELDRFLFRILDALKVIHANDILHRDIKPANIYIQEDGNPVILDFGSARYAVSEHSLSSAAVVSRYYSPYESYGLESKSQGAWTDIYGLAATIYRSLTGAPPPEAVARIVDDEYVPLIEQLGPSGAYRLEFLSAVDKGLAVFPKDRPQSIEAWLCDLLPAQENTGSVSTPVGTVQQSGLEASISQPIVSAPQYAVSEVSLVDAQMSSEQVMADVAAAPKRNAGRTIAGIITTIFFLFFGTYMAESARIIETNFASSIVKSSLSFPYDFMFGAPKNEPIIHEARPNRADQLRQDAEKRQREKFERDRQAALQKKQELVPDAKPVIVPKPRGRPAIKKLRPKYKAKPPVNKKRVTPSKSRRKITTYKKKKYKYKATPKVYKAKSKPRSKKKSVPRRARKTENPFDGGR